MIASESARSRALSLRVDRGEEIPNSLISILEKHSARAGIIQGIGALDAVELTLFDPKTRSYARTRRIDYPCTVLSLTGTIAMAAGQIAPRLLTTVARETDSGLQVLGGEIVWAKVNHLELFIHTLDDVALTRQVDPATGASLWTDKSKNSSDQERHRSMPADGPPVPIRPQRAQDEIEIYPDSGDLVHHFHFGECTVIDSDGERLRLRQMKDGRVREVSVAMLKVNLPEVDPESGKRKFQLNRKN